MTMTMIVPAALKAQCSALCEGIAGTAGSGMFETGLYTPQPYVAPPEDPEEDWTPPPKPSPSHYISTGWIADAFQQALPCTSVVEGELVTRPADYEALTAMAQAAGITVTQAELEAIFSQCDISDQPWRDAVARLGLSLTPKYEESL